MVWAWNCFVLVRDRVAGLVLRTCLALAKACLGPFISQLALIFNLRVLTVAL